MNLLYSLIWLLILCTIAFPVSFFCAGWYVLIFAITACIPALSVSVLYLPFDNFANIPTKIHRVCRISCWRERNLRTTRPSRYAKDDPCANEICSLHRIRWTYLKRKLIVNYTKLFINGNHHWSNYIKLSQLVHKWNIFCIKIKAIQFVYNIK